MIDLVVGLRFDRVLSMGRNVTEKKFMSCGVTDQ